MIHHDPPFRWNISKREQLGRLIDGVDTEISGPYLAELRQSAARLVSQADGAAMVFVGRSPESYFDYFSGLFHEIDNTPELTLFQYSGRFTDIGDLGVAELQALRAHMSSLGIDPNGIATRPDGVAFCDLVSEGGTYAGLVRALAVFSAETSHNWRDIQQKLRLIGLTERTKTSPNTWRWYQHRDWEEEARYIKCSSISVDKRFWRLLGDYEDKTTRSNSVEKWLAEPLIRRDNNAIAALARAATLFDLARSSEERQRFTSSLVDLGDLRSTNTRNLIKALRS